MTNNNNKNRFLLSLLAVMATLASAEAKPANGTPVPKVVVSILIDQLRSDYMEAFMPLYGDNGFRRLLREGRVYAHGEYPMTAPDRASAAATLVTGTTPYNHGIIGRSWLDRSTLRKAYCVDDARYPGIGTSSTASPAQVEVSTLGDELKVATNGKALVYSIAPFRDMAVLGAGHAADGVVWIDDQTGNWCTSAYYGTLPAWAGVHNNFASVDGLLKNTSWQPSSPLAGNFSYFLSGGMSSPFSHKFKGEGRFRSFKTSALVNESLASLAKGCLNGTAIGTDGITDYMAVAFYAGTFNHQPVSEASMELQDTYVRLDKAVADLMEAVEKKVGAQNAIFVLTSTGYSDEPDAAANKFRIPAGTFDMKKAGTLLNMYLMAIYGKGQYVEGCYGRQIYLNHKLLEERQINISELYGRIQDFLLQLSGVKDVYTAQRLQLGAWTGGLNRIRGGYNSHHSGDVVIEVAPGWHFVNEDTQENQLVRLSYVPFPIIIAGGGITAGTIETPVSVDCIAPTLTKAIRIRAPSACEAAPLPSK